MGNSKIPAYGGGCCGSVNVPVARVVTAPTSVVDYSHVLNKPTIAGVELVGDISLEELGLDTVDDEKISELFR